MSEKVGKIEIVIKGGQPWGFRLQAKAENRSVVIVDEIVRGGRADQQGKLKVGDHVIKINGIQCLSLSDALQLIESAFRTLTIVVWRTNGFLNKDKPKDYFDSVHQFDQPPKNPPYHSPSNPRNSLIYENINFTFQEGRQRAKRFSSIENVHQINNKDTERTLAISPQQPPSYNTKVYPSRNEYYRNFLRTSYPFVEKTTKSEPEKKTENVYKPERKLHSKTQRDLPQYSNVQQLPALTYMPEINKYDGRHFPRTSKEVKQYNNQHSFNNSTYGKLYKASESPELKPVPSIPVQENNMLAINHNSVQYPVNGRLHNAKVSSESDCCRYPNCHNKYFNCKIHSPPERDVTYPARESFSNDYENIDFISTPNYMHKDQSNCDNLSYDQNNDPPVLNPVPFGNKKKTTANRILKWVKDYVPLNRCDYPVNLSTKPSNYKLEESLNYVAPKTLPDTHSKSMSENSVSSLCHFSNSIYEERVNSPTKAGDLTFNPPKRGDSTFSPPKPGDLTFSTPIPIDSTFNTPKPVDSTFNPPKPGDLTFNPPKPGDLTFNAPKPGDLTFNSPIPIDSTFNPPKPVDSNFNPPKPVVSNFNPPKPSDPAFNPPKPSDPSFNPPKPSDQAFNPPKPGDSIVKDSNIYRYKTVYGQIQHMSYNIRGKESTGECFYSSGSKPSFNKRVFSSVNNSSFMKENDMFFGTSINNNSMCMISKEAAVVKLVSSTPQQIYVDEDDELKEIDKNRTKAAASFVAINASPPPPSPPPENDTEILPCNEPLPSPPLFVSEQKQNNSDEVVETIYANLEMLKIQYSVVSSSQTSSSNVTTHSVKCSNITENITNQMSTVANASCQDESQLVETNPQVNESSKEKELQNQEGKKKLSVFNLPFNSAYFTTSVPKAKLLTRYTSKLQQQNFQTSKIPEVKELSCEKEELSVSLRKKLDILLEEEAALQEELQQNEELGKNLSDKLENTATQNEWKKYTNHVQELEKITNLLLSLSGRSARTKNALLILPSNAPAEEKMLLEAKYKKLTQQYEEALQLQKNIDNRNKQVLSYLQKYFTKDELGDYNHFIKMKVKLLVDYKELVEKIKLGEEQLKALTNS